MKTKTILILFMALTFAAAPGGLHADRSKIEPECFRWKTPAECDFCLKRLYAALEDKNPDLTLGISDGSIRFQDPTDPVKKIYLLQFNEDADQLKFNKEMLEVVAHIDPKIEAYVIHAVDNKGAVLRNDYCPHDDENDSYGAVCGRRDMQITPYRLGGGKASWQGRQHPLYMSEFTFWARDFLIPFQIVDRHGRRKNTHWVQMAHHHLGKMSLEDVLCDISKSDSWHFMGTMPENRTCTSEIADEVLDYSGLTKDMLEEVPNYRNYGGNILPLNKTTAIVGSQMTKKMTLAITDAGLNIISAEVPTYMGHVDEFFTVIPDKQSSCGIALFYASPELLTEGDNLDTLNSQVAFDIRDAIERVKGLLACPEMKAFPLPMRFFVEGDRYSNPLNSLVFPLRDRIAIVMPKANSMEIEDILIDRLGIAQHELGYPIEVFFINSNFLTRNDGNVHCATNEVRYK